MATALGSTFSILLTQSCALNKHSAQPLSTLSQKISQIATKVFNQIKSLGQWIQSGISGFFETKSLSVNESMVENQKNGSPAMRLYSAVMGQGELIPSGFAGGIRVCFAPGLNQNEEQSHKIASGISKAHANVRVHFPLPVEEGEERENQAANRLAVTCEMLLEQMKGDSQEEVRGEDSLILYALPTNTQLIRDALQKIPVEKRDHIHITFLGSNQGEKIQENLGAYISFKEESFFSPLLDLFNTPQNFDQILGFREDQVRILNTAAEEFKKIFLQDHYYPNPLVG